MTRRILTVALASTVVALVLFLVPLALAVLTLFQSDAQASLQREALRSAVLVDPRFSAADVTELPHPPSGIELSLYNAAGRLMLGRGPTTADAVVRRALRGASAEGVVDGQLTSVIPISASEKTTGAIRAAIPQSTVWSRVLAVWGVMLLAAVIALAVGIVSARALARRITRPMTTLSEASVALGAGDFGVRMPPSGLPEIDQVGSALNATAVRLGQLVERERAISAQASHQLRTPLSGLRAVLERALTGSSGQQSAAIAVAIERADALSSIIDDILQLARGPMAGSLLDPRNQIDAAEARWRGVLADEGRSLLVEIDADLPETLGVESALHQIFDVLLDNATRHGAGRVVIRARKSSGSLAFDVEDEGHGEGQMVDPLGGGASTAGGRGLGLPLAVQLARDQGGRLLLSERVRLTRFTLILPPRSLSQIDDDVGQR
jgi:signal transduction histidine kinase